MKILFSTLLLNASLLLSAQDTTIIEQYCDMVVTGIAFSNKVSITLDFGKEPRKWMKDYKLRDEQTGKLKEFNTVTDAMNFMGAQGWSLVNAFPVGGSGIYHYYFRKRFKRTELVE